LNRKSHYDFILIDSRTGVTEIGGICTVQLPDKIILLFSATVQGFHGTLEIAERASNAQQKLPYDRQRLTFIPIPTKFDTQSEYELSQKWLDLFSHKLGGIYKSWLPYTINIRDFIEKTKVPYITYFSFGEKLPVLEQGTTDPTGLGYAYENLAGLIANDFDEVETFIYARDKFINKAKGIRIPIIDEKEKPFKIFISYSRADTQLKDILKSHLSVLSLQKNITFWDAEMILPGEKWHDVISKNLKSANLFLLLISPDYLSSKSVVEFELEKIIDIALTEKKIIVPILARPTNWEHSQISEFQMLPRSMKPISLYDEKERDKIFIEITEEIKNVVEKVAREAKEKTEREAQEKTAKEEAAREAEEKAEREAEEKAAEEAKIKREAEEKAAEEAKIKREMEENAYEAAKIKREMEENAYKEAKAKREAEEKAAKEKTEREAKEKKKAKEIAVAPIVNVSPSTYAKFNIEVASEKHCAFAEEICREMEESAKVRGTGIAKRSPEYVREKMREGKAVIAMDEEKRFAGFSYIESWSHEHFVAILGLIVNPKYRRSGLDRYIPKIRKEKNCKTHIQFYTMIWLKK